MPKRQSKMQLFSEAFAKALHDVFPSTVRPDEMSDSGASGKAPDHFLIHQQIAIERKSVSVDIGGGKSNGEKLDAVKDEKVVIFGTVHVEFSEREFRNLADKMTGKVRRRIADAEEQLVEFCGDKEILSVCCLFTEITKKRTLDWDSRNFPTREMVRSSADVEFRQRDIDALVLFTSDEMGLICVDVIQTVYKDGYLQEQFDNLTSVLRDVFLRLPFDPDLSVTPATFFVPEATETP